MKITKHRNPILIFAITMLFAVNGFAQDDCKVLLEAISGQYDGDCKKGMADGEGTAKGEDTYVGEFKKGYPHGTGTYTWANGDVFFGEFKKGLKDGSGKLTISIADGLKKSQEGYWSSDKYIGVNKEPYQIINRSPGILSVRITETNNPADDGNALFVEIQHKGRIQQSPDFNLSINSGSIQNRFPVGNKTKVLVSRFPLAFTLSYKGENLELQISQETSWNITIDYNIQ